MNDTDALINTILTLVFIFINLSLLRLLVFLFPISVVIEKLEEEIEEKLNFFEVVSLFWFLSQNLTILDMACEALNKNESVYDKIYMDDDAEDDDDDGGDLAMYHEDLVKT